MTAASVNIRVEPGARRLLQRRGTDAVTFELRRYRLVGCCWRILREVEPVFGPPADARPYRYFHVEGLHIYVSRQLHICGPLILETEGWWLFKRLCLRGVSPL